MRMNQVQVVIFIMFLAIVAQISHTLLSDDYTSSTYKTYNQKLYSK